MEFFLSPSPLVSALSALEKPEMLEHLVQRLFEPPLGKRHSFWTRQVVTKVDGGDFNWGQRLTVFQFTILPPSLGSGGGREPFSRHFNSTTKTRIIPFNSGIFSPGLP